MGTFPLSSWRRRGAGTSTNPSSPSPHSPTLLPDHVRLDRAEITVLRIRAVHAASPCPAELSTCTRSRGTTWSVRGSAATPTWQAVSRTGHAAARQRGPLITRETAAPPIAAEVLGCMLLNGGVRRRERRTLGDRSRPICMPLRRRASALPPRRHALFLPQAYCSPGRTQVASTMWSLLHRSIGSFEVLGELATVLATTGDTAPTERLVACYVPRATATTAAPSWSVRPQHFPQHVHVLGARPLVWLCARFSGVSVQWLLLDFTKTKFYATHILRLTH